MELVGVAGDDVDVGDGHPELVGDDLGKAGEVTLALRADSSGNTYFSVCLDLDARTFIRPDAGPFYIAHQPEPQVFAFL